MKVKFKKNSEPCLQYEVKDPNPVFEWDEYLGKYCECIEIEMMGLVPKELLTETNCSKNLDATELAICLTNDPNNQ